ncbi:uncharacterized protein [Lepisosteus oculatus]
MKALIFMLCLVMSSGRPVIHNGRVIGSISAEMMLRQGYGNVMNTPQIQAGNVKPFDTTAGFPSVLPMQVEGQMPQPPLTPQQVMNMDPMYGNFQLISFMPQVPIVSDQQTQGGFTYLPAIQLISPLSNTDVQPPMYTIMIQQAQTAGSASSEEPQLQPIVYSGILIPVITGGINRGITKNEGGGATEEDIPTPRGILPTPENREPTDGRGDQGTDPAHQGSSPTTAMPELPGGTGAVPESPHPSAKRRKPAGVHRGGGAGEVTPCEATPATLRKTPSTRPGDGAVFVEPTATAETLPRGFSRLSPTTAAAVTAQGAAGIPRGDVV